MTDPKTIDNLGIDVSRNYAYNIEQEKISQEFIKGSKQIGDTFSVSVTTPYINEDLQQYASLTRSTPWAFFTVPPNFLAHQRAIFTFNLIPSLGSFENLFEDVEKMEELSDKEEGKKDKRAMNERDEKQKKERIIKLLKRLGILDKYLHLINGKRKEYHKG